MASSTRCITVKFDKYPIETVRYAAYAASGSAYVLITAAPGGAVVRFEPKPGGGSVVAAERLFRTELEDELLRSRVAAGNRELREFLLLKALNYRPPAPQQEDSGLTPQQEKELNDLISQIESEIKAETAGAASDPLGITSTWEDKYERKDSRKKAR